MRKEAVVAAATAKHKARRPRSTRVGEEGFVDEGGGGGGGRGGAGGGRGLAAGDKAGGGGNADDDETSGGAAVAVAVAGNKETPLLPEALVRGLAYGMVNGILLPPVMVRVRVVCSVAREDGGHSSSIQTVVPFEARCCPVHHIP